MRPTSAPELLSPAPVASFTLIDLDCVEAAQVVQALAQQAWPLPPQVVVDCSHLKCLRHLGVSHVVSQLLAFHRGGAHVSLRNAAPVLLRCLRLLQLDGLFPVI